MGQSSFFRRIKKILSPEKTVFFMRGNRFFRYFCLKESSLTAEKNFFLWGLSLFFARKNLFLLCLGSYVREGEGWEMGRKFCAKKSSFTVKKGREGWRESQTISMIFCVKETSFVENGCISCVFQKTEKNKKKAAILYERSSFLFEKQKPL